MEKYPEILKQIKHYEEVFNYLSKDFYEKLSFEQEIEDLKFNRQKYQRDIILTNESYMKMIWFIPDALMVSKRDKIEPQIKPISAFNIDYNEIDINYLNIAINNKKPVILVNYEAFKYYNSEYVNFIIDGNHRAVAKEQQAHRKGIKDPAFKAIQLNVEQTIEVLIHDVFRVLYKIHSNVNRLKYLDGKGINVESEEVMASLFKI